MLEIEIENYLVRNVRNFKGVLGKGIIVIWIIVIGMQNRLLQVLWIIVVAKDVYKKYLFLKLHNAPHISLNKMANIFTN